MILNREFFVTIEIPRFARDYRKKHCDSFEEHKVPPPYERADDGARSLNGRRDDEFVGVAD
jgi:hypothetical protein